MILAINKYGLSSRKVIQVSQEFEEKHIEQINNPKINEGDNFYNDRMILLVHEMSNWHLYYDPEHDFVYSIAVVPGAKSSSFGSVSYFKKWYSWKERNHKNTILCLTEKAIQLLGI